MALVKSQNSRWLKNGVIIALAILWLGGNKWVAVSLLRSLEWQYFPPEEIPQADVIVVLGGATDSQEHPRQIVELNSAGDRMFYAGWLYHQGAAPHLLLAGGYIPWLGEHQTSPAEEMGEILKMLGVPQEAIWLETQSLNTHQNALYCAEILQAKGISRIILVTSASHMPRSVAVFEHQGLEVIPAPTDYAISQAYWDHLWEPSLTTQIFNLFPTSNNLNQTTGALKEYFGILVYALRGWL